jgi:hypothetical protein
MIAVQRVAGTGAAIHCACLTEIADAVRVAVALRGVEVVGTAVANGKDRLRTLAERQLLVEIVTVRVLVGPVSAILRGPVAQPSADGASNVDCGTFTRAAAVDKSASELNTGANPHIPASRLVIITSLSIRRCPVDEFL